MSASSQSPRLWASAIRKRQHEPLHARRAQATRERTTVDSKRLGASRIVFHQEPNQVGHTSEAAPDPSRFLRESDPLGQGIDTLVDPFEAPATRAFGDERIGAQAGRADVGGDGGNVFGKPEPLFALALEVARSSHLHLEAAESDLVHRAGVLPDRSLQERTRRTWTSEAEHGLADCACHTCCGVAVTGPFVERQRFLESDEGIGVVSDLDQGRRPSFFEQGVFSLGGAQPERIGSERNDLGEAVQEPGLVDGSAKR